MTKAAGSNAHAVAAPPTRPAGLLTMRRLRGGLIGAGVVLTAYGLFGAATDSSVGIGGHLLFLAAVLVGHDWILMPIALGIGALIARPWSAGRRGSDPHRVLRARSRNDESRPGGTARPVIAATVYVSGMVGLVALPFVLGLGRRPDDPSALPLDYGRGLAVTLGAVWAGAALTLLYRWLRDRRPPGLPSAPPGSAEQHPSGASGSRS